MAAVEKPYLDIGRRYELTSRALKSAEEAGSVYASATAALLVADVLFERGQRGDAEQAFANYKRSLDVRERLLNANPDSAPTAHDVAASLDRLGDFLASRGQCGDAKQASVYHQRGRKIAERLPNAKP